MEKAAISPLQPNKKSGINTTSRHVYMAGTKYVTEAESVHRLSPLVPCWGRAEQCLLPSCLSNFPLIPCLHSYAASSHSASFQNNLPASHTYRKPESAVPQEAIQSLPGHPWFYSNSEVLCVQLRDSVHLSQVKAYATLLHQKGGKNTGLVVGRHLASIQQSRGG